MKRVSKNILAIGGSDLTRKIFGFLSITYLTRHITVSDFGIVSIAFTVLSYVLILSASGLPALGTREIAREFSQGLVARIISARLLLTIAVTVLTITVTLLFVSNPVVAAMIILISLSAIPNALFLDWFFQGKEAMSIIGIARAAAACLNFFIIILFVKSSTDILWVAAAAIVSDAVACCLYFFMARKETAGFRLEWNFTEIRSIIARAFPIGVGSTLAHISINLAPLAIGVVLTTESVGIFSAANKFVFFLMIFDRILATLLFPASSRIYSLERETFIQRLEEAQKWVFVMALPICAGGMILSSELVQFIFGSGYAAAGSVLAWFIWFLLLTMLQTVFNTGLIAAGREKEYARVMAITAMLYGFFVIAGTLLKAEIGAAVGIILAETISVLLSRAQLQKVTTLKFPRVLPQIAVACVVMLLSIIFMPHVHLLILISIGAFCYGATALLVRAITLPELQAMGRRVL